MISRIRISPCAMRAFVDHPLLAAAIAYDPQEPRRECALRFVQGLLAGSAENYCRSCASGDSGPAWPSPGAERPHHAGEKEIWLTHYHGTVRVAIYRSRLRPAAIGPRQQRRSAMPFCGRSSSSPRSRLLIGQADVLETPRPASRTFLLLQSVGRLFRPLPFQTGGSPRRAARSD
jgi:hypothetical protein